MDRFSFPAIVARASGGNKGWLGDGNTPFLRSNDLDGESVRLDGNAMEPWEGPAHAGGLRQGPPSCPSNTAANTTGPRSGSPSRPTSGACPTLGEAEFRRPGEPIVKVVDAVAAAGPQAGPGIGGAVRAAVSEFRRRFPIYRRRARSTGSERARPGRRRSGPPAPAASRGGPPCS